MRARSLTARALLAAVLHAGGFTAAQACQCRPLSRSQAIATMAIVVKVRVQAILAPGDPYKAGETTVSLRVLDRIKGRTARIVTVSTPASGMACGLNFVAGDELTLGLSPHAGGFWANSCMFVP